VERGESGSVDSSFGYARRSIHAAAEAQWEKWQQPATVTVRIDQGVPRILHLFLVMVFVSIMPVFVVLRHFGFEKKRWADSDYSPFGS
jgi:hypothetical protein